jgi:hypothetical protein
MMANFTDRDILRLDKKFAEQGIPFHARPFHAAVEILGDQFHLGRTPNPAFGEIDKAYARLFPTVATTWPGAGVGIAASVDQVRKVTQGVDYGCVDLTVHEGLGFSSQAEWFNWCRNDRDIGARSCYALADIHDFIHGINHAEPLALQSALALWAQAASNLEDIANCLSQSYMSSTIIQSICLVAELAMKGTLYQSGMTESAIRSLNHDHKKIARRLISACPHRDDQLLQNAADRLPNYVAVRYADSGLSRLQIIDLALGVQFIAASSLRRVGDIDLAREMDAGGAFPGRRWSLFSK